MKTLKAFWHWVDNENPSPELYAEKALDNLSDVARAAIVEAERLVGMRAGAATVELLDRVSDEEHGRLRPAFRDLSLALCAALEHMHEQVEDDYLGKRYPARPDFQTHAIVPEGDHAPPSIESWNDYLRQKGLQINQKLAEWLPPTPTFQREYIQREYMGQWFTSPPLSSDEIERSKRMTEMQLAAMNQQPFRSVGADGPKLANMQLGRVLGRSTLMNDDGLKLLRPEPRHDSVTASTSKGGTRVGSTYDPATREMHIFDCIERAGADALRGFQPKRIFVHGIAKAYSRDVLLYLAREVLGPLQHGGANIEWSDPFMADFFFGP